MSSANLQKNKDQCMGKNLEQLTPKSLRQVIAGYALRLNSRSRNIYTVHTTHTFRLA